MFENDKVSSPLEAYLLGFIYADGFVSYARPNKECKDIYYALGIGLSIKDRKFLQDITDIFNIDLGKSYKLHEQAKTNSVRVVICNKLLVNRLIKLGIVPNKTYQDSSFVFDNVPNEFKRDFIRGFFDGDGTVGVTKRENKQFVGFVTYNKSLAEHLFNYLHAYTTYFTLQVEKNKYYRIYTSGINAVLTFRDLIYYDNCFCMKRKHDKLFSFVAPTKPIYHSIYKYHLKYKCNYKGKYIGLFSTIKDAIDAYNSYAIKDNKECQVYVGEVL